jgi:hypothetical protein
LGVSFRDFNVFGKILVCWRYFWVLNGILWIRIALSDLSKHFSLIEVQKELSCQYTVLLTEGHFMIRWKISIVSSFVFFLYPHVFAHNRESRFTLAIVPEFFSRLMWLTWHACKRLRNVYTSEKRLYCDFILLCTNSFIRINRICHGRESRRQSLGIGLWLESRRERNINNAWMWIWRHLSFLLSRFSVKITPTLHLAWSTSDYEDFSKMIEGFL